ncbi:MAG: hypothetical protein AAF357_00405, partial [Verrucomicrobiota bacterium]
MRILPPSFLLLVFVSTTSLLAEDDPPLVETVTAVRSESLATEWELTGTVVSKRESRLSSRVEGL